MNQPRAAQGLHLIADLQGCPAEHPWMIDLAALRQACTHGVQQAGLQAVGDCFHQFPPGASGERGGVTGMVLLAESHLAVHTWPENGQVTLDVFVCNVGSDNSAKAHSLLATMVQGFEPQSVQTQAVRRGNPLTAKT